MEHGDDNDDIQEIPEVEERQRLNSNYGFSPLGDSEDSEDMNLDEGEKSKKRKREEESTSAEAAYWKHKIARLIARYPGLTPRTSKELVEALNKYGLEELKNIHDNCISDVVKFRGTPSAELILTMTTHHTNKRVPGFQARCMNDIELKRDIEEEVISALGFLDNKINILFRFFNNLYRSLYPHHFGFSWDASNDPLSGDPNIAPRGSNIIDEEDEEGEGPYIRPVSIARDRTITEDS